MDIKITSICKNYEFRRIYGRGKSFVSLSVVLYVIKNRQIESRLGITTSKKIGNAVKRNRARRVIRHAAAELWPGVKKGYDLVVVSRGKTPYLKSTDIEKSLKSLMKQAKLLSGEGSAGGNARAAAAGGKKLT